jgi:uncharacterized ferritin-like protein (DUF455 family)
LEIRDFARQVLFGSTLDDKLARPGPLRDAAPGAALPAPDVPGRPPGLVFGRGRAAFPAQQELESSTGRGRALHAFANHELLAIELMALCLLRFPDAPAELRREILRSLVEEQQHLRLYLRRMDELGVGFGDVPVNDWFWRCLSRMQSPAAYLAGLSLTFEQANLDFASHYARVFHDLGDATSGGLLDKVHDDEIDHVGIGVRWLPVLTGTDPSVLASTWAQHQPPPLTPARGRGMTFDAQSRQRAGLSDAFIATVRTWAGTKGRPPERWRAPLAIEAELRGSPLGAAAQEVVEDLAPLVGLLAQDGDELVLPRWVDDPEHVASLMAIGLPRTRPLVPDETRPCTRSWAPDLDGVHSTRGTALHHKQSQPALLEALYEIEPDLERVYGPRWTIGRVVRSLEALEAARTELTSHMPPEASLVLKSSMAASGRGLRRVRAHLPLDASARGWVTNQLTRDGGLVVEPWLDRVVDLSVPLRCGAARGADEVLHALIDGQGRPGGHVLGRRLASWSPELRRRWSEGGLRHGAELACAHLGSVLAARGPLMAAGLDMFLFRLDGKVHLRPLVELNVRYTMGHVALVLEHRLVHGSAAVWLHVPLAAWQKATTAGWRPLPPEIRDRRLLRGDVPTTSPASAKRVVTVLCADHTWEALVRRLPREWLPASRQDSEPASG